MKWRKRPQGRESEATQARRAAERDLERVKSETPEYADLGSRLKKLREQNHLTELILSIPHRRHP